MAVKLSVVAVTALGLAVGLAGFSGSSSGMDTFDPQIRMTPEENRTPALPAEAKAQAVAVPYAPRTGDNHVPFRINGIGRG
jgi:hypothetical protein